MQDDSEDASQPTLREVRYEYTPQFPEILAHLNASILVTTYQAGKLLVLGVAEGKLQISFLSYEQPMGLAVSPRCIAIGTRKQMHFLVPAHETQADQTHYDGCFVPRSSLYTGNIHGHDLGWGNDGLWVVNTLFSSLATLHEDFSFVPQWRPPFISQLIDQDRCHLNGMAVSDGAPRYVSALSQTDTAAGWRPTKATSGVIMEVPSGNTVCQGLSMPHSPRIYADRLWALNSGYGALGYVDTRSQKFETVEAMPGYTRGLSFCGQFAFVGLSRIRETSVFGGIPIAEHRDQLRCGIGVVDLTSGKTVAVFQFFSGVSEIFAVEVLPGFRNPLIAGASVDQQEREVWIVPAENAPRPVASSRLPIFSTVSRNATAASVGHEPAPAEVASLGLQLRAQGRLSEAAKALERAISISPNPAPLLVDLGNLRQDQNNQHSALISYQRALEADPTCIAALQNLGYLLFNMGEAEKSRDVYDQLLALEPSPLNQLLASSVLPVIYDSPQDIDYWRDGQLAILKRLVQSGGKVDATKTLVPTCFFAAYQGRSDRELMELRGKAIEGRDFTSGRTIKRSNERLKVGFISAYFRDHTIGRLNIGRLEKLARQSIELTIVHAGISNDGLVKRFMNAADRYVTLPRDLPSAIQRLSEQDLDILVHADVGMDALTQTLAFSRFAPIQIATWGHPDTTGSRFIDYYLTSQRLENSKSSEDYTEKLLMLPSLGIDYERPGVTRVKSRVELGLPADRHLYGCPQTLFKFHPDFDEILGSILRKDPKAEVVLLEGRLPEWTHRLRKRFRRTLPDADHRIRFLPSLPREDFLSLLACVDVLLDPLHFGGGNSSIESVAMGTPLVTMEGKFLRSRITSTLFQELELHELIAANLNEYVRIAVQLACDMDYRLDVQRRMLAAAEQLFQQSTAAQELEECLLSLVSNG